MKMAKLLKNRLLQCHPHGTSARNKKKTPKQIHKIEYKLSKQQKPDDLYY